MFLRIAIIFVGSGFDGGLNGKAALTMCRELGLGRSILGS